MFNELVTLVYISETEEDDGDLKPTGTKKEVLANIRSIGMKEKYTALSNGLDPEMNIVLADYLDYNGEQFIEYGVDNSGNPIRYRVLRTFRKDGADQLEIVVTR